MDRAEVALIMSIVILTVGVGIGVPYLLTPAAPPRAASAEPRVVALPSQTPRPSAAQLTATIVPATSTSTPAPPTSTPPTPRATVATTPIPSPPTVVPSATRGTDAAYRTHTVKRGDTLNQIARAYGVTAQTILDNNRISNPSSLVIGQVLQIPPAATNDN